MTNLQHLNESPLWLILLAQSLKAVRMVFWDHRVTMTRNFVLILVLSRSSQSKLLIRLVTGHDFVKLTIGKLTAVQQQMIQLK